MSMSELRTTQPISARLTHCCATGAFSSTTASHDPQKPVSGVSIASVLNTSSFSNTSFPEESLTTSAIHASHLKLVVLKYMTWKTGENTMPKRHVSGVNDCR